MLMFEPLQPLAQILSGGCHREPVLVHYKLVNYAAQRGNYSPGT